MLGRRLRARAEVGVHAPVGVLEHLVLGLEVVLHGADRDARAGGDRADARALQPGLGDDLEQHVGEALTALVMIDRGRCHTVVWYACGMREKYRRWCESHPRLYASRHVIAGVAQVHRRGPRHHAGAPAAARHQHRPAADRPARTSRGRRSTCPTSPCPSGCARSPRPSRTGCRSCSASTSRCAN